MNGLRTNLHLVRILFSRTQSGNELRFSIAYLIYRFLPLPKFIKIPIRNFAKRILKAPVSDDYQEWIRNYDMLTDQDRQQIREHIRNLANKPLISIIMPV